ncbi:hypothetical protein QQ008_05510 [Fulvivirgaceae bacterium BMA10]|uniref:Uncharacterized protein n=1 Tax=Splendidivirga corallicola TaxID=3051826 RepID=A0ABT8KK43_9BACT|nr:hypothetical protein [Fulvivirgaceae bacterium BMA10]
MCKTITLSTFFYFFLFTTQLFGQIHQPERVEIDLEFADEYFFVVSAKKNGLIIFRETRERGPEGRIAWEFIKYNTSLEEEWKSNVYFEVDYEIRGYEYRDNRLYLLFKKGAFETDGLQIMVMDLADGVNSYFDIDYVFPLNLTEFTVAGNAAILGGYVNYMPAVLLYNFSEKKIKVLPGIYNNRSELVEVNVDEEKDIFSVLLTEKTYDKRTTLTVKTFDDEGTMLQNKTLETQGNNSILFGRSSGFGSDYQLIAGTYANGKSSFSSGIFISKIGVNDQQDITYISYGDLKNFFSYMKASREERVRNRINRRTIKGKKVKFRYRLLVHDLIEHDGINILLGEAFYPKYNRSNISSFTTAPQFRGDRNFNNYNFAGYKYTHAVVIAFNDQGKVLWDNSFEINDVTSYSLDQFVNVMYEEDRVILLYQYENVIRSKIIKGDEVIEGKTFDDIKLKFEDDVANNNDYEFGGLEHWYDKKFFGYGIQRIKNMKDRDVKLNRKVFYINKIAYN